MSEATKMVINQPLENKFTVGQRAWFIFNLGPQVKVNEFEIRAFSSQKIGDEPMKYVYGFQLASDGHEGSSNLSYAPEDNVHLTQEEAKEKAVELVELLRSDYDTQIEEVKLQAIQRREHLDRWEDETLAKMLKDKELISIDNLDVEPKPEESTESQEEVVEDGEPTPESTELPTNPEEDAEPTRGEPDSGGDRTDSDVPAK